MTLDEVVDDYIARYRPAVQEEIEHDRKCRSVKEAIRRAALEKRSHQYRIPFAVLHEAERRLQRIAQTLSQAPTFELLHDLVDHEIGALRGIGALAVYDIAHRIAVFRRKSPKRVYLHRGTAAGARHLGFTGKTLEPCELPPPFSRLSAAEIEDCLCIYKDDLRPGRSQRRSSRQRDCAYVPMRRSRKC